MTIHSWGDVRRRKVSPDHEAAQAASTRALRDALDLAELRKRLGVTQMEMAGRLGVGQPRVSALERRDDVYLSTLREYIEALGGHLELTARFEGEDVPIAIGAEEPIRAR